MREQNKVKAFEETFIPHLDAAFNLARWLTRNDQDAQDVVQEAYLRALKFFSGFQGRESRAWLLTIVRNTCYTWMRQHRSRELSAEFDEETHSADPAISDPAAIVSQKVEGRALKRALEELPLEFREAMVLRELEGLSYKEIADITNVPIGTVMSRLARARTRLQQALGGRIDKEG